MLYFLGIMETILNKLDLIKGEDDCMVSDDTIERQMAALYDIIMDLFMRSSVG